MKVILFGASGMLGRGVLRACLLDPAIERVLSIARTASEVRDDKLREVLHANFEDFSALKGELSGYDACFFCLGVSAAGMSEADYTRVTYDFTLAAARAIIESCPRLVFVYVSGEGTDSREQGRSMWARVKGRTENALKAMPWKSVYLFRPGLIQPMHGIVSKTRLYRIGYVILTPMFPVLRLLFPTQVTTNEKVALAMLRVAKHGADKTILRNPDINALAALEASTGGERVS